MKWHKIKHIQLFKKKAGKEEKNELRPDMTNGKQRAR